MWEAVRADWRTAPVSNAIRAVLGFIEKQTLHPDELTRADAEEVFAAGVSREALLDAAKIAALFNMIVRLADSFGWDVPEWGLVMERAPAMLDGRYRIDAVRDRAARPARA